MSFYIYTSSQFMKKAGEFLDVSVSEEAIQEAEEVGRRSEENATALRIQSSSLQPLERAGWLSGSWTQSPEPHGTTPESLRQGGAIGIHPVTSSRPMNYQQQVTLHIMEPGNPVIFLDSQEANELPSGIPIRFGDSGTEEVSDESDDVDEAPDSSDE